jgi:hypothetical protein
MALFNSCYAAGEEGGEESGQNGCGLVGIGAMDPLVETFKKSLLSASKSVIKKLRHRQEGRGRKRVVKQRGAGKRKQGGGGRRKDRAKKSQRGAGKNQRVVGKNHRGTKKYQRGGGQKQWKKQLGKGRKCISRNK